MQCGTSSLLPLYCTTHYFQFGILIIRFCCCYHAAGASTILAIFYATSGLGPLSAPSEKSEVHRGRARGHRRGRRLGPAAAGGLRGPPGGDAGLANPRNPRHFDKFEDVKNCVSDRFVANNSVADTLEGTEPFSQTLFVFQIVSETRFSSCLQ